MKNRRLARNIRLGIKNLLLHKTRSLLTMLGVVFGVASVISMLAVGEGASEDALEQIRKLGSANIIIRSEKPVEEETGAQRTRMSIYGLSYQDEEHIRATLKHSKRIAPAKIIRKEARLAHRALEIRLVGTTPEWFDLVQREMIAGRPLAPRDVRSRAGVVVLTEHGARRLLATRTSIGESLRIGGEYFEVVGIIRSETGGSNGVQTPDREVDAYVPLSTARERFGDIFVMRSSGSRVRERVELHQLIVEADEVENVETLAAGLERLLVHRHPKGDYRVSVPLALLRQAEATKRTFNIVLGSIAGISLLVGGIGIMNIMLASVTERTREIGVRRAIGARKNQIVAQFLIETVVLSTMGGAVGVLVGIAVPRLISQVAGVTTIITPFSLILSVGISVSIGILFGLYPAIRAANLDPIEALRHE